MWISTAGLHRGHFHVVLQYRQHLTATGRNYSVPWYIILLGPTEWFRTPKTLSNSGAQVRWYVRSWLVKSSRANSNGELPVDLHGRFLYYVGRSSPPKPKSSARSSSTRWNTSPNSASPSSPKSASAPTGATSSSRAAQCFSSQGNDVWSSRKMSERKRICISEAD